MIKITHEQHKILMNIGMAHKPSPYSIPITFNLLESMLYGSATVLEQKDGVVLLNLLKEIPNIDLDGDCVMLELNYTKNLSALLYVGVIVASYEGDDGNE